MLLRHGSLPLLLLLWLATAQGATLATLYQAQEEANPSAEPAGLAGLPAVEAPVADAALNDLAADALAGRPDAGSEAQEALTEATEPQPETGAAREPLSNSIEAEEPQTGSGDAKDPVSNSIDAKEPQPDSTEAPEPQPDSTEDQEPQPDSTEAQEPQPDSTEAQEPQPDSTEAPEPQPDSTEAQEPVPETGGAKEPLPESGGPQEPLPESGGPQEPLPETEGPQEPLPESGGPQDSLTDSTEAQDPLPETGVSQDPTPDTLVADGDVETEATQDPMELSPVAADLSDDSDAPDLSAQETLPEEEWAGVPGNTELQTGKEAEDSGGWGLSGLRGSFQTINGYFDSMVELVGGRNGVCQYRCRHGSIPQPRPDYQIPEPDGCTSSLIGMQFDLGIPAMTQCCDKLDQCYDTCGSSKSRCDSKFRWCLHSLCTDLKTSLGFVSKVKACESGADALYNTVSTLGCRPYMNSQRAACVCTEEEREEL
ncbi:group XIIB secretory phospholipase A2-like protein isoform X2 [Gadus macrocephalus]|uniref:group XIIB secretory phospholipase A2-like protein isoform X2 n=1 Tax=Gadus macrocephalus TaxID=80720 RepID=UPI0028CBB286|nr:group XIIB secretory phospholipase A2-like protein isoform X2 [Gadus macrocephalus]